MLGAPPIHRGANMNEDTLFIFYFFFYSQFYFNTINLKCYTKNRSSHKNNYFCIQILLKLQTSEQTPLMQKPGKTLFNKHKSPPFKSNQIKSLLLSHHHSTSALVSEILMSVLQTVQKNNRQFTYGQRVQKKQQQTIYIWTDSAKKNNKQFTYGQTVQKTALEHLQCSR